MSFFGQASFQACGYPPKACRKLDRFKRENDRLGTVSQERLDDNQVLRDDIIVELDACFSHFCDVWTGPEGQ